MYLRAANGRIPELKRVVVAYQNRIVMEETLDAALARLFPAGGAREAPLATAQPARPVEPAASGALAELATQAQRHYELALRAQREGDWAQYGEEIRQLGEVLQRMRDQPSR